MPVPTHVIAGPLLANIVACQLGVLSMSTESDPSTTYEPDPDIGLDERAREELRQELIDTRARVLARGRLRAREALGEMTALADEADLAATSAAQFHDLRLAEKDRKLVGLIEHALDKFMKGTYGLCEGSEEPIPLPRLRLRPWARYSIEHKQQLEHERAMYEESDE